MSEPWRTVFLLAVSGWLGALVLGMLAIRLTVKRLGLERAWPAVRLLVPLLDLVGTWAGTAAVIALAVGRRSFGLEWAAALGLAAVMITASLYDRAVLVPSLDAALKRIGHSGGDDAKWEAEWRFMWRMSHLSRVGTLAMGLCALLVA